MERRERPLSGTTRSQTEGISERFPRVDREEAVDRTERRARLRADSTEATLTLIWHPARATDTRESLGLGRADAQFQGTKHRAPVASTSSG